MFLVSVKSETLGHVPKGNALYGEVTGRQNILLFCFPQVQKEPL